MSVSGLLTGLFRLKRVDLSTDDAPLRRCLTTLDLTLLGIASMVGVTLYILTGVVARDAGPSVILSYSLASIAAMFAALCYAELGSIFPKTGSAYLFTYSTIGELPAFIAGWSILLEYLLSCAIVARGWSGYLDSMVDNRIQNFTSRSLMGGELWTKPFIASYPDVVAGFFVLFFVLIVAVGARVSAKCNKALLIVNFAVVTFISVGSFIFADGTNWSDKGFFPNGIGATVSGASILFIGYVGFDVIAVSSEEALDSKKGVPHAIMSAILSVSFMYIVVSTGLTLAVPYYEIGVQAALATPFAIRGIHWAKYVVDVGALCSMSACMLTTVFALPRMVYAMSSHGLFFTVFSKVNPSTQTPLVATVSFGTLAALMAIFFDIGQLSSTLSIGTLTAFTFVAASVMMIRYKPLPLHRHIQQAAMTSADGETDDDDDDDVHDKAFFLDPKEDEPITGGQLKTKFQFLTVMGNFNPGTVPCVCFFLTTCLQFATVFVIVSYHDNMKAGDWWAILLCIVLVCSDVLLILPILVHEQVDTRTSFKAPFVPLTPMASILCNIILIMLLSTATWARFAIWIAIGLVVYFLYGYRHSNENIAVKNVIIAKDQYKLVEGDNEGVAECVLQGSLKMPQPKNKPREEYLD